MTKFRYLSPEEYAALDADQKAAYIDAALDQLIARDALVPLRVDKLRPPDPDAAAAPAQLPPDEAPQEQAPQQQQQQQQPPQPPQPPPAQDAQPSAPAKDQPGQTSRKEEDTS
jgi:hypothetical protein